MSVKKQGRKSSRFAILSIVLLLILVGLFGCEVDESEPSSTDLPKSTSEDIKSKEDTKEDAKKDTKEEAKEDAKEDTKEKETEEPKLTIGQENALKAAKDYIDYTAFSYKGLVEQLEFEEYSQEDAKYAADNCGADWNEQAALKAKEYLDYSSFSRSQLIEQLEFEGFTKKQAEYGAKAVGY